LAKPVQRGPVGREAADVNVARSWLQEHLRSIGAGTWVSLHLTCVGLRHDSAARPRWDSARVLPNVSGPAHPCTRCRTGLQHNAVRAHEQSRRTSQDLLPSHHDASVSRSRCNVGRVRPLCSGATAGAVGGVRFNPSDEQRCGEQLVSTLQQSLPLQPKQLPSRSGATVACPSRRFGGECPVRAPGARGAWPLWAPARPRPTTFGWRRRTRLPRRSAFR